MRRWPVLFTLFALLAIGSLPARGDLASMVADLAAGAGPNRSSYPDSFTRVGSRVVFFAPSLLFGGSHPWVTDGTPAGTGRLPVDEAPAQLVGTVGSALLWFGSTPAGGFSLWRSGGTAATTQKLVADRIYEPPYGSVLAAASGDRVHFLRRTGPTSGRLELWVSDGTAAGTGRVSALGKIGDVFALASHGGKVYFLTASVELHGGYLSYSDWKLWRTGGPAPGAYLVRALPDFDGTLYPTARRLLFFSGGRLWASDGTSGGTQPVAGPPGEADFFLTWIGGTSGGLLYFGGRDALHGDALWASDGTGPGTQLLAPGLTFRLPLDSSRVHSFGDQTFFVAADADHGAELWSSRGTAATTSLVADLCPGPCSAFTDPSGPSLAVAGGQLFMLADDGVHGTDLWITDGSAGGIRRVVDLDPAGTGSVGPLRSEGGEVFFYQRDAAGTVTLWGSDGTPEGTRRLTAFSGADPAPFVPSFPTPSLAALGPWIVTTGYDPRGGFEPWALRRNGQGGRPLGDLDTASAAPGSFPSDAAALGDRLLFWTGEFGPRTAWSTRGSAETTVGLGEVAQGLTGPAIGVAGGVGYFNGGDLWATDGTAAGTVRLTDFAATPPGRRISTAVLDLGGRAVFGVNLQGLGTGELWTSDGTPAGTRRAGPPAAPFPAFPGGPLDPAVVGNELFFWADDGESGWQVWTTDATLTTLTRLTDRDPDLSSPYDGSAFTRIGDRVYFLVPKVTGTGGSLSLWRTDGTQPGAEPVPSPPVGDNAWWRTLFGAEGRVLLLISDSDGSHLRLFSSDGSGTDWAEIRDFGPRSWLDEVLPGDDESLIVMADEGRYQGLHLYRTDGTAAGTVAIVDLASLGVVEAYALTRADGRLFFAGSGPGGTEPWVSDGTQAGTRRVQDVDPGPKGSEPGPFIVAGSRLYFPAYDGLHGRELWSLPLDEPPLPCRPSATALCLGDGRFRAELFLHDRTGRRGDGRAVAWSSTSGAFWLYGYGDPEAAVKMVDGSPVNGRSWLFYGPLGNAYAALTVTDLVSGDSRRYPPDPGPLPAFADLRAFPGPPLPVATPEGSAEPRSAGGFAAVLAAQPELFAELEGAGGPASVAGEASLSAEASLAPGATLTPNATAPCQPTGALLCLVGGRFAVDLVWRDAAGGAHPARAFAHGDGAGYFAFGGGRDVQAALKILDGRPINGRFWLFASSLTHLGYTLRVTDTETGAVHSYFKPLGEISSLIDVSSLE